MIKRYHNIPNNSIARNADFTKAREISAKLQALDTEGVGPGPDKNPDSNKVQVDTFAMDIGGEKVQLNDMKWIKSGGITQFKGTMKDESGTETEVLYDDSSSGELLTLTSDDQKVSHRMPPANEGWLSSLNYKESSSTWDEVDAKVLPEHESLVEEMATLWKEAGGPGDVGEAHLRAGLSNGGLRLKTNAKGVPDKILTDKGGYDPFGSWSPGGAGEKFMAALEERYTVTGMENKYASSDEKYWRLTPKA